MLPSINMELTLEKKPATQTLPVLVALPKNPLSYLNKYWNFHSGIDFSVPKNTALYAVYPGTVYALGKMGCAGNTLIISHVLPHKKVVYSVYEHLQSASKKLKMGTHVTKGQLVARSGKTGDRIRFVRGYKDGCVGGPHLHFELRIPKTTGTAEHDTRREKRFVYIETQTTSVNPSDYIREVDGACQLRKDAEMRNALSLAQVHPDGIPPITAGLCSQAFESRVKNQPPLYKLTRQKEDLEAASGPSVLSSKPL